MRGTLKLPHMEPKTLWGSSPRMRGTQKTTANTHHTSGIIPAYAGNTNQQQYKLYCGGDHPRVCGEHMRRTSPMRPRPGSSPRMRGTLTAEQWLDMHRGIIPAYAGNTMRCSARYYDSRDHPRVCGEHIPIGWKLALALGSSPRMRGTRIT